MRRSCLLILSLSVWLAACGGGGGGGTKPSSIDFTQACESVSLQARSFAALESMRIEGVTDPLAGQVSDQSAELYAEARESDKPGSDFLPLPVFIKDKSGELKLGGQST